MPNDLKVSVTAPLIERATERDSRHCMIAEAMMAARPDFRAVVVDLATIRWSNPRTGKRYICLTPERARAELVNFDRGDPIEPFDLLLRVIQVTAMTRVTETRAEARADGRRYPRRKVQRGSPTLAGDATRGPLIVGGKPLPAGHLSNVAVGAVTTEDPPAGASNVIRSSRRYRQYGLRQLAQ